MVCSPTWPTVHLLLAIYVVLRPRPRLPLEQADLGELAPQHARRTSKGIISHNMTQTISNSAYTVLIPPYKSNIHTRMDRMDGMDVALEMERQCPGKRSNMVHLYANDLQ